MGLIICDPRPSQKWEVYCIACKLRIGDFEASELQQICITFDQGVFCDCCADHRRVLRLDAMLATIRAYERRHTEMVQEEEKDGLSSNEIDTKP